MSHRDLAWGARHKKKAAPTICALREYGDRPMISIHYCTIKALKNKALSAKNFSRFSRIFPNAEHFGHFFAKKSPFGVIFSKYVLTNGENNCIIIIARFCICADASVECKGFDGFPKHHSSARSTLCRALPSVLTPHGEDSAFPEFNIDVHTWQFIKTMSRKRQRNRSCKRAPPSILSGRSI